MPARKQGRGESLRYCYVDEQAWEKREIHEDDMLVGMREIAVKVTDEDSGSATVIQYGVL